MKQIEVQAADALLDRRLKINLPAPWPLRTLGVRTIPIWARQPVGANVIRMSRLFTKMDIDIQNLMEGRFGTLLECVGEHGVTVSRIIACGLIRGSFSAWLWSRPLAWYIRCHMTIRGMAELARIIVLMSSPESFVSIIASVAGINLLEPTSSQTETGS